MDHSLLPNIRWLTLPSEGVGGDWEDKINRIDRHLEFFGYELSEESVYLLYSHPPHDVLAGIGQCLIARAVIGPKKSLEKPFALRDWTASSVLRGKLTGVTLKELLESAADTISEDKSQKRQADSGFMICLKRRLENGLTLSIEAIFPE